MVLFATSSIQTSFICGVAKRALNIISISFKVFPNNQNHTLSKLDCVSALILSLSGFPVPQMTYKSSVGQFPIRLILNIDLLFNKV